MSPDILVSIDPGLAHTAVARWVVREWAGRGSWLTAPTEAKLDCLASVQSITTKSSDSLTERLLQIAQFVSAQCEGATRVFIEVPQVEGAYWERKSRQRTRSQLNAADMAGFNRALGATLVAAALQSDVEPCLASRMSKDTRHAILARLIANVPDGAVPVPKNEHERDAVWVGLAAAWSWPARVPREGPSSPVEPRSPRQRGRVRVVRRSGL